MFSAGIASYIMRVVASLPAEQHWGAPLMAPMV